MRTILRSTAVTLFSVASTFSLFAGDQFFDLDNDPTGVPGFILYGNHGSSLYQFFDGSPSSGGYIQLTDGSAPGGETGGIVFPDVDLFTNAIGQVISLPIKALRIEMDLRIGNGTRRPADGFSISFCRQNDRALASALQNPPVFANWAGGDSVAVANDVNGNGNPESGTRTGLAISFDTWQGNWLRTQANLPTNATPVTNDKEGILVRLDDVTLGYVLMTNRNGGCFITELNPGDPCIAVAQAATNSMQTGPWSGPSANTGDGGLSDGGNANLSWQRFTAEVDANRQVTVTWKGATILNHFQLTNYPTSQGRLILAARTGGSYEHTHLDNVRVITTPSVQPITNNPAITGLTNGFRINILNVAQAQTTNFPFVSLDGTDVTSLVVRSNFLDVATYGIYTQAVRFLPKSTHTVVFQFQDALGQRFTNGTTFTVPPWLELDPATAVALAQVDTSKPGFKIKSFQSLRYQPNQLRFTEEQVIGIRGPNDADQSLAVGGFYTHGDVVKFSNGGGGNLFPNPVTPFSTFGIGVGSIPNSDNSTIEMFGYLYFPTNGDYIINVGSDDSFRLTFAANPLDRMGAVANEFDGGRGLGQPGDQSVIRVAQPGCYPFRMLWENGGGGADLQWLTGSDATTYKLINDTNNPGALLAYQDVLPAARIGAYVKRANPVRDAQNVVFFQPILVELGNGTGNRTVNQGSIVLKVDGTNQGLTITSPDASTTRIVSQMGTNVWSVGLHTNLLTFSDNAGTNYTYIWPFTVINANNGNGISLVPANTVAIPLANMVPAASVDVNKPGYRVKSWQSPHDNPNHLSWTEQQLQGLHGPNVANQVGTSGLGYFVYADATGSEGNGVLDLKNSNGGTGEWNYHQALEGGLFGIGDNGWFTGTGLAGYRFNFADNDSESCALDFGFWLVFPAPGTYIFHVNSDDGEKMLATTGNPFSKLGIVLTEANVGRGVGGASGAVVGGDYRAVSIPAAGAYPFRIVFENGGTGGGIEFSVYKFLPDGGVAKLPVNDSQDPNSIKAFQTLTSGTPTPPYVSYANPPYNNQETTYWQPIVVELTDGPAPKGVNTSTIQLAVDGTSRSVSLSSPSAGVTRITQLNPNWLPVVNIAHTAVLTYSDNSGTSYTNTWPFTVMNVSPYVNNQPGIVVNVPASSAVPINTVDHTKPGLRVYAHQTAGADPGSMQNAEEQLLGLRGANIADLSGASNGVYFVVNDVVDFADGYAHNPGFSGYDTDSANGRYRYNYAFQRFGFNTKGGLPNTNGTILAFAGYMEFPAAGLYAMAFNSDDGFKVTVPLGNPRSQAGTILGWRNGTGGQYTGTAFGPQANDLHFVFNIPAPGAYPIRALWYNGNGGLAIEWTIYQFMPDGSIARTLVGDTNTPGAIKVYQDSSLSGPYVTSISPAIPYQLVPNDAQVMRLNFGTRNQDMVFNLQDGNTTVTNATLTVNGVAQPLVLSQPGGGVTTVTRFGTNALPAGYYGPASFSYKDSAGRTYTLSFTLLNSDFSGTVQGGFTNGVGDPNKRGFLWRTYQVDGNGTAVLPTHVETAEQALAGIWTNNFANLASAVNGFFVRAGTGESGSNGLINFNQDAPSGQEGDFRLTGGAVNGYPDQQFPGMPGLVTPRPLDSIVGEATAYVEFPTNGTYTMGVNSDDGFRVTRGWGAPVNNGALVVNSPASIAGQKPAVSTSLYNTDTVSTPLTNVITGQIVQALGVGNGATDPTFACAITNGAQLAGKIALIYRGTCNERAKVQNAAAAGAIAVVYVQDRPVNTPADGWFPTEVSVNPMQPIPMVMIARKDGDAIVQALSNNTAVVNVTLKPITDIVNPPANSPVLGQASWGKGASDILFNVNVPTAGVYPMRLLWQEGGGGANCEWFSIDSTSGGRVLINDANSTNGPALKAFYGITVRPTVSLQVSGGNATVNYTGTLQTAPAVTGPWTDVYGQPPLVMPLSQAAIQFFRSR